MSKTRITPPAGWELQISIPDFGPGTFDATEGMPDIYQSTPRTMDGETSVFCCWNHVDGMEIFILQKGSEITLPSPWAARKLAELLWQAAAEAES